MKVSESNQECYESKWMELYPLICQYKIGLRDDRNVLQVLFTRADLFFLLERHNVFAICNKTFSKWWEV
jgi:hypothetical protein